VWGPNGWSCSFGVCAVSDIAAEIRDILVFHLGVGEARLKDDARLAEDLGADSLDRVEIVMSCEERFDIEIPNDAATQLKTVGDMIRFAEAEIARDKPAEPTRGAGRLFAVLR
jgi:acyl carrier protein